MTIFENLKNHLNEPGGLQKNIFIIKSDDHALNNFFIQNLKEVMGDMIIINQFENEETPFLPEKNKIQLLNIQTIDQGLIDRISVCLESNSTSSLPSSIYFLPREIIYHFIERKTIEHLMPSCLFISEVLANLKPSIFEKLIHKIYKNESPPALVRAYSTSLFEKGTCSTDKLVFYAYLLNQKYFEFLSLEPEKVEDLPFLNTFLNIKGIEFINYFSGRIPLETIEGFFRSFLDIRSDTVITRALSFEKLSKSIDINEKDLKLLLEISISQEFEILVKEDGFFKFKIQEYLVEWEDLKSWIKNEQETLKQYKQLAMLAKDYFKAGGPLLSKEQIEQALNRENENPIGYHWEEKYKIDKTLISTYIKLSKDNLEEALKKQQKKRKRLLKNSVRISIAVSIAFLLSSFTALIAYLERNSAIKQQELALIAKEEADKARANAEAERLQAELAKQNESIALRKAEIDRMLAIESKGQAEQERKNALIALDMAEKSAQEASLAREVAEKNEELAKYAQNEALINFQTSERLRNQQEARASSLEALRYYDNGDYETGFELAKSAFNKNVQNGGFPFQSDIFLALLSAKFSSEKKALSVQLDHPGKLIAISPSKNRLGVFTIDGQIIIFNTKPNIAFYQKHNVGYIQSLTFINNSEILYTNLEGKLFKLDLEINQSNKPQQHLTNERYRSVFKIPNQPNLWIASQQKGGLHILNYDNESGFMKTKEKTGGTISAMFMRDGKLYWAEKKNFFVSDLSLKNIKLLYSADSEISGIEWSNIYSSWVLGMVSGHLIMIDPENLNKNSEPFLIHESKINKLKIIPYSFNTELLISTGYDGNIYLFTLHESIPFSSSISSRISLPKHRSWITGFSTDIEDKLAYTISNDRTLKIWPFSIESLLNNYQDK